MMKILPQCLLLWCCTAFVNATEILAWKTTLESIAPQGLMAAGAKELEKPPEASPFFGPKDKLYDLKSLLNVEKSLTVEPEWVVWNANTGRVVAKGSWSSVLELQHKSSMIAVPLQCRIKIDIYKVAADGLPPDSKKMPDASLSFVSSSGYRTKAGIADQDAELFFESEAVFSMQTAYVHLQLNGNASLAGYPNLSIDTGMILDDNSPIWLARDFDGKSGMDVVITSSIECTDGTLFRDLVLRQDGDRAVAFPILKYRNGSGRIFLNEKQILIWSSIGANDLLDLCGVRDYDEENNPFSPSVDEEPKAFEFSRFKELMVPENLAPHFYGNVFEVSESLKNYGVIVSGEEMVGYDPKTQRIFMTSSDESKLDIFEQLFSVMEQQSLPKNIAITLQGKEEMRLISQSGGRSNMASLNQNTSFRREFEIEPIFGDNVDLMDVRFKYEARTGDKAIQFMDSTVTIENGKPLKVFEKEEPNGARALFEIRGDRVEIK